MSTNVTDIQRLDLIVCDFCNETISYDEHCYELAKKTLDPYSFSFETLKTTGLDDNGDPVYIQTCIRFHKHCFQQIAGDEYTI